MKGLILKDLLNLKSTFKTLGIIILVFCAIFISQGNSFIYGMIILMCAMLVVTSISYDDLAKWDIYALTMPVTRKELVLSKYLLMGILNSVGAILSLLIGSILSLEVTGSIDIEIIAAIGIIYLIAYIFGSVMIPLIYRFGVEKARLLVILCGLLPAVLILVVQQFNIPVPEIVNPMVYLFLLMSVTVIIVFCSYLFSLRIYSKKEF